MSSLDTIIRELRRAAARARAARYAVHGLVAAAAWVALVLLIARLTPVEQRATVAAVGIPAALAIAAIAWLLRRPSAAILMRLAAIPLGLHGQGKLRRPDGPRTALESITPGEQQLQRLTDPGTPALSSSAQNLANALSGTAAGRTAAQAISTSPAKGAQSVRDLAAQLQNMSPKDRQDLAKALEKAAQQAQNSQMRDSLSKASSSLQNVDPNSAAQP